MAPIQKPTTPNSHRIGRLIPSASFAQKKLIIHTYYKKVNMNHHKADTDNDPKLDLKLNLSPPSPYPPQVESPNGSVSFSSMEMSPISSCVSSEFSLNPDNGSLYCASSPEPAKPMMLAGCPRCLMYVMLSEEDPKCPKCKGTVLLEILPEEITEKTTKE
ncbi:unnamed protein product [Camellia sinensis]